MKPVVKAWLATLPETDDCILWPFYVMPSGYGSWKTAGRTRTAHSIVCEMFHGPCPPGAEAAHGPCHDRSCVNPRHLSWKTSTANHLDMVRDGTHRRGERHPLVKLTAKEVKEIRYQYSTGEWTHQQLADEFGIGRVQVTRILNGKRWSQ